MSRAWQSNKKALLSFLMQRTHDAAVAEDLLQEVFVKALRQGRSFCELRQPRAWLFEVARNALIDQTRRQRDGESLDDNLAAPPEPEVAPIDTLTECIGRNIRRLQDVDQDVLQRCDLQGWRQQDYAKRTGIGLPAAKARLRRARLRLRALLIERCGVRFDAQGSVCCTNPDGTPARPLGPAAAALAEPPLLPPATR